MPDPTRGADRTKVLSVRFTAEEFDALSARATEVGVGPSTLARTYVRQALADLTASTSPTAAPHNPSAHHTPSTPSTPSTPPAPIDSALEARLEALLAADLVARVEALERRTPKD